MKYDAVTDRAKQLLEDGEFDAVSEAEVRGYLNSIQISYAQVAEITKQRDELKAKLDVLNNGIAEAYKALLPLIPHIPGPRIG